MKKTDVIVSNKMTWQSPAKRLLSLMLLLVLTLSLFAGCHGSVERAAFVIPEDFDIEKLRQFLNNYIK